LGNDSPEIVFEGPYPDRYGHPLCRYDDVRLSEKLAVELINGSYLTVPAGTLATLLFYVQNGEGEILAHLEVYPDEDSFGFADIEPAKVIFEASAASKLTK